MNEMIGTIKKHAPDKMGEIFNHEAIKVFQSLKEQGVDEYKKFKDKITDEKKGVDDKIKLLLGERYDLATHFLLKATATGNFPPKVSQKNISFLEEKTEKVPTCFESAMLDLFSILWYDPSAGKYDDSLIPHGEGFKSLKKIVSNPAKINSHKVVEKWFNLICNMPEISYKRKANKKGYEIDPRVENVVNIINYVCGTNVKKVEELGKSLSTGNRTITLELGGGGDDKQMITVSVRWKDEEKEIDLDYDIKIEIKEGWHTSLSLDERDSPVVRFLGERKFEEKFLSNLSGALLKKNLDRFHKMLSIFPILTTKHILWSLEEEKVPSNILSLVYYSLQFKGGYVKLNAIEDFLLKRYGVAKKLRPFIYKMIEKLPKDYYFEKRVIEVIAKSGLQTKDTYLKNYLKEHPSRYLLQLILEGDENIEEIKNLLAHKNIKTLLKSDYGEELLKMAVKAGSVEVLKVLLKVPEISVYDRLLQETAAKSTPEVVKELLKDPRVKAKIDAVSEYLSSAYKNTTPLYVATLEKRKEIVGALLNAGANPNLLLGSRERSMLVCAQEIAEYAEYDDEKPEEAKEILTMIMDSNKTDPNFVDKFNRTPLNYVLARGKRDFAKRLLDHKKMGPKIDPNIPNKKGFTPLYHAAKKGLAEIVEKLLNHPKIDLKKGDQAKKAMAVAKNEEIGLMIQKKMRKKHF